MVGILRRGEGGEKESVIHGHTYVLCISQKRYIKILTAKINRIFALNILFFHNPVFSLHSAHTYSLPVPSGMKGVGVCVYAHQRSLSRICDSGGKEGRRIPPQQEQQLLIDHFLNKYRRRKLCPIYGICLAWCGKCLLRSIRNKNRWILLARKHNFTFPKKS